MPFKISLRVAAKFDNRVNGACLLPDGDELLPRLWKPSWRCCLCVQSDKPSSDAVKSDITASDDVISIDDFPAECNLCSASCKFLQTDRGIIGTQNTFASD